MLAAFFPSTAIAESSGQLSAEMSVPFECAIVTPPKLQLAINGQIATVESDWSFSRNGAAKYSMNSLEVIGPENADVTGEIIVKDDQREVMLQKSERKVRGKLNHKNSSVSRTPRKAGIKSASGRVEFVIIEQTESIFVPGDYTLISVLGCEEDLN